MHIGNIPSNRGEYLNDDNGNFHIDENYVRRAKMLKIKIKKMKKILARPVKKVSARPVKKVAARPAEKQSAMPGLLAVAAMLLF